MSTVSTHPHDTGVAHQHMMLLQSALGSVYRRGWAPVQRAVDCERRLEASPATVCVAPGPQRWVYCTASFALHYQIIANLAFPTPTLLRC
jgi:hypothetical protein